MKRIYHIFVANRVHLTPQILKSFFLNSTGFNHIFLLWRCSKENKIIYDSIIKDEGLIQCFYIDKVSDIKKYVNEKNTAIILHSIIKECCIYLFLRNYTNVSLVYWGSGMKNETLKNKILYPWKKMLYNFFRYNIVLMDPDKESLQNIFHLNNIFVLPYMGERERLVGEYLKSHERPIINDLVYIGNNFSCLNSYFYLVKSVLFPFRKQINVQFMMHYDVVYNDTYKQLVSFCQKEYSNWRINEELYDLQSYIRYMDMCSIYVCAEDRQTGLGAIYTCLRLGKKIYIYGKNYDWIKSLGCVVFNVKDIEFQDFNVFVSPLSEQQKEHNRAIIERLESSNEYMDNWNNFFSII